MLKKKLGIEAIERDWQWEINTSSFFKIPTALIIPEGCERIGKFAFESCNRLKKAVIPRSVHKIYDYAFSNCDIRDVEFFGKRVGNGSFRCCFNLVSVTFSENIKAVNVGAFWNCLELRDVIIPKSIESIESSAFGDCEEACITIEKPRREFKYVADDAFFACKSVNYVEEKTRY